PSQRNVRPQRDQKRKRNEELQRCGYPEPVASRGMVLLEHQSQQKHQSAKSSGLPQMIPKLTEVGGDHGLSFPPRRFKACSASLMSSSVRSPDLTSLAMTGRVPNMLSISSMRRFWAAPRDTAASKMFAFPILRTSFTAALLSIR